MPKILKGDLVVVLSGKDKGREGRVLEVLPAKSKAVVEGVNVAKRHQRPIDETNLGGIIDKTMPIHLSNIAVISPEDGKATRVGYKIDGDGKKVRVCKRTGVEIK